MPDPSKSIYATGRRKHAVARVWMQPGSGKVDINRRTLEDYFGRETSRMVFRQAMELTETSGRFDIFVNVSGGGLSGQADAIRHGLSRALPVQQALETRLVFPSSTGLPAGLDCNPCGDGS